VSSACIHPPKSITDMTDIQERYYEKKLERLKKAEWAEQDASNRRFVKYVFIACVALLAFLFLISPGLLVTYVAMVIVGKNVKDITGFVNIIYGLFISIPIFLIFFFKAGRAFKKSVVYYSLLCVVTSSILFYIAEKRKSNIPNPGQTEATLKSMPAEASQAATKTEAPPPSQPETVSVSETPKPSVEITAPAQSSIAQSNNDLLLKAANCSDIKNCITIILEAADPRSPEAISIAATRIGEQNTAKRGDRKVARALNQTALEELAKGNHQRAIELLVEANAADPADVEILSNLGFVNLRANRPDDAVGPLSDALILDPRRTSTWSPISELYALRGKPENAVRALLLAYEFSSNKDKTLKVFEEKSTNAEREVMRPVFAEAYKKVLLLNAPKTN